MTQVKVRAGQVWDNGSSKVTAGIYRSGLIRFRNPRFESQQRMSLSDFYAKYKFVPQNDLETLAVKLDKWYCAAAWLRIKQGVPFICEEFDEGAINEQQWQNMRYYLGLDKKPHCKRVDGEWVKQ